MLQRDGPVGEVLIADAPVTGPRSTIEPRIRLTTEDTDVYGIVQLADDVPEDSTLTVTWYRLQADGGRKLLFTHEIAVPRGGGRASSQGVARDGLAEGAYETVATLRDHQVRSRWFVRAGVGRRLSAAADIASSGSEPEAGEAESWGDEDVDPIWGPDELPGPCTIASPEAFAWFVSLAAHLDWAGTCETVTLSAAVTGTPRTFASIADPSSPSGQLKLDEWYCDVPGGSDLPGTVIRVVGAATGVPPKEVALTLPNLREEFVVQYTSSPAIGTRVEPGDTIRIRAEAARLAPALGIKVLYLDDGTDLIDTTGNVAGTTETVRCRPGQHGAVLPDSRYRVPDDPPSVIEICAHSEGFDGEKREHCGRFPTGAGEVWNGTMDGTITIVPPGQPGPVCPNPVRFHGEVSLVVAEDGATTGSVDVTGAEPPCIDSFDLTGTKTDRGFSFPQLDPFFVNGPIPIVGQGRAEARATHDVAGTTKWVTDWKLSCSSCAAGG